VVYGVWWLTIYAQELTFEDWILFVTVISILKEEELLKFLYFCYDKDKNGFLEMQEVRSPLPASSHYTR
jgi:hypothetical protein